ncbi:hypothetical protein BC628DRAFT_980712 [Trametes gibbosa]|nr:hypothetical protein BC628DRAFT_980712 [Trametes gibbosa]
MSSVVRRPWLTFTQGRRRSPAFPLVLRPTHDPPQGVIRLRGVWQAGTSLGPRAALRPPRLQISGPPGKRARRRTTAHVLQEPHGAGRAGRVYPPIVCERPGGDDNDNDDGPRHAHTHARTHARTNGARPGAIHMRAIALRTHTVSHHRCAFSPGAHVVQRSTADTSPIRGLDAGHLALRLQAFRPSSLMKRAAAPCKAKPERAYRPGMEGHRWHWQLPTRQNAQQPAPTPAGARRTRKTHEIGGGGDRPRRGARVHARQPRVHGHEPGQPPLGVYPLSAPPPHTRARARATANVTSTPSACVWVRACICQRARVVRTYPHAQAHAHVGGATQGRSGAPEMGHEMGQPAWSSIRKVEGQGAAADSGRTGESVPRGFAGELRAASCVWRGCGPVAGPSAGNKMGPRQHVGPRDGRDKSAGWGHSVDASRLW